jgi:hypothetical protein
LDLNVLARICIYCIRSRSQPLRHTHRTVHCTVCGFRYLRYTDIRYCIWLDVPYADLDTCQCWLPVRCGTGIMYSKSTGIFI